MAQRTWFVKLNLDELADELDALDSDAEYGQWLKGFRVGSRGHEARETWEDPRKKGYAFGIECFNVAEEFRGKQSEKGLKSAESRRGTIQPRFNHGSTTVATAVQPRFNHGSTTVDIRLNEESGNESGNSPENNENSEKFNHGSTTVQPRLQPRFEPELNQPEARSQKPEAKNEEQPPVIPQTPATAQALSARADDQVEEIPAGHQRFIKLWNDGAEIHGLPKIQEWAPKRRAALKKLATQFGRSLQENMEGIITTCQSSDWVKSTRQTVDHLLRPDNFQRYLDQSRTPKAPQNEAVAKPGQLSEKAIQFRTRKIAELQEQLKKEHRQMRRDEADKGINSMSCIDQQRIVNRIKSEIIEFGGTPCVQ